MRAWSNILRFLQNFLHRYSIYVSLEASIREYKYLWLAVRNFFTLGSTALASDTRLIVKNGVIDKNSSSSTGLKIVVRALHALLISFQISCVVVMGDISNQPIFLSIIINIDKYRYRNFEGTNFDMITTPA